ncbi:MAG: hypothetical protein MRQ13_05795 [Candidatus Midichloria sp.]|nr:hypothetical protein [Candidatus Midichloria sp.]
MKKVKISLLKERITIEQPIKADYHSTYTWKSVGNFWAAVINKKHS